MHNQIGGIVKGKLPLIHINSLNRMEINLLS